MKVLELFAGTRSIGKAFENRGHEVFSVEWDKDFENINLYADIGKLTAEDIISNFGYPDVIWASPDCATFSIAAISHHRTRNEETGNLDPKSDYAKFCDQVDMNVLDLIKKLHPKFYFIENPRGGMRKMKWMQDLPRYTVTYCQYGDTRMKPTDIWTNHPNPQFKPMCKNGDPCHEKAPRGSKTGTQGLKGSKERSVIPEELCNHIVDICEQYYWLVKERRAKKMELKIFNPTEDGFIKAIEWNHEEIKKEVTEKVDYYKNLVYTDDQIKEAKADRATLRKFVEALEAKRKDIKKQCLQPYEVFEKQMKEIVAIVNEPVALIDSQVKGYEEKQKEEKKEKIIEIFDSIGFQPFVKLEMIWDEKWLNASVTLKKIEELMKEMMYKFSNDLLTLSKLPEFGFEATEIYKTTLDINKALEKAQSIAEIAKKKAEYEAAMKAKAEAEEKARIEAETKALKPKEDGNGSNISENQENEPDKATNGNKRWISFAALLSTEDAIALKEFFNSRNIEFKAV